MTNIFSGKIDRQDFVVHYLATIILNIISIFILTNLMNHPLIIGGYGINYEIPTMVAAAILTLTYLTSLFIRRLRDIKLTPWFALVVFFPPIALTASVIIAFVPSKK